MRKYFSVSVFFLLLVTISMFFSGCTIILQKGRRVDVEKISKLKSELSEMERAQEELRNRLKKEIGDKEVKHSGWKSNWELSTARSLSVLHYLVQTQKVDPSRLSAIGYGKFRPVASNDTKAGRYKNRRVEIVIIPKTQKKRP